MASISVSASGYQHIPRRRETRWTFEGSVRFGRLREQLQQVWRGADDGPATIEDSGIEGDEEAWEVLPEGSGGGKRDERMEREEGSGGIHQHRRSQTSEKTPERLDQLQSPLFRLPTEIRLYIYMLVLYVPTAESGLNLTHHPSTHAPCYKPPTVLALLQTCRRILVEAEDIFYTINRLVISSPGAGAFLSSLKPGRLDAITTCSIPVTNGSDLWARLVELQAARSLKSIHVYVRISIRYLDVSSWKLMADQVMRELQKAPRLRELRVILPRVEDLTSAETARMQNFERMVEKLKGAVGGREVV